MLAKIKNKNILSQVETNPLKKTRHWMVDPASLTTIYYYILAGIQNVLAKTPVVCSPF